VPGWGTQDIGPWEAAGANGGSDVGKGAGAGVAIGSGVATGAGVAGAVGGGVARATGARVSGVAGVAGVAEVAGATGAGAGSGASVAVSRRPLRAHKSQSFHARQLPRSKSLRKKQRPELCWPAGMMNPSQSLWASHAALHSSRDNARDPGLMP